MVTAKGPGAAEPRPTYLLFPRLSLMMFLQYFVQGCYLPIAALYVEQQLGFSDRQIGYFISALAVGPILAPFLIGQIVDRAFSTERVMAFCHFVGGVLMLALFYQLKFWPVIVLATVYSVVYVPTMMLSNSLTFQHLKNSDMWFPWVRAFGTIGFITPAFIIEPLLMQIYGYELGIAFALSGCVGILMGLYCLSLPHTPPAQKEKGSYAPGVVLAMLFQRHFLVIVGVTFLICIAHNYFFAFNSRFLEEILAGGGWENPDSYVLRISSIGQWCEIGVMAILGFWLTRFGFKWTLIGGAAAYMVRCLLFSVVFGLDLSFESQLTLACTGQALHGFCFGFFLAVGYMYVDRISPRDVRGSMQNIYGVFVVGLGFFVGGLAAGEVGKWFTTLVNDEPVRNWTGIWLTSAALCALCVVLLFAFYPSKEPDVEGN